MTNPCIIVRNDIDVCDGLADACDRGAFSATMERNEHSAERVRIESNAGAVFLLFCPFCGESIIPPFDPNEGA